MPLGSSVGAYYGVPLARRMYDRWFSCTPPYWCRDPFHLRLELERQRRMEELRERATPPEPRIYGPVYGMWGLLHPADYIRSQHPARIHAARASCGPSTNSRAGHTTSPSGPPLGSLEEALARRRSIPQLLRLVAIPSPVARSPRGGEAMRNKGNLPEEQMGEVRMARTTHRSKSGKKLYALNSGLRGKLEDDSIPF